MSARTSPPNAAPRGLALCAGYVSTRFGLPFSLLSLVLALTTARISGAPVDSTRVALLTLTCALALLGWRVLDDLQDRDADGARGESRLSVTGSPRTLAGLAIASLALACLAGLSVGGVSAAAGLLLVTLALLLLGVPAAARAKPWLVLLKYPACVGVLAEAWSVEVAARLVVLYLAFLANEVLHDARWLGRPPERRHHTLRALCFLGLVPLLGASL